MPKPRTLPLWKSHFNVSIEGICYLTRLLVGKSQPRELLEPQRRPQTYTDFGICIPIRQMAKCRISCSSGASIVPGSNWRALRPM